MPTTDDEQPGAARALLAALTTPRRTNPTPVGPRVTTFTTARAERRAAGHRGNGRYPTTRHTSRAAGAIKEPPLSLAERQAAERLARKAAARATRKTGQRFIDDAMRREAEMVAAACSASSMPAAGTAS